MLEEINQPIEVVAIFKESKLIPWKFLWPARPANGSVAGGQGKEYLIKKINLTYSSWEGRNKVYYFAVSDNTNYFKLKFNTENLKWTLLESYVD